MASDGQLRGHKPNKCEKQSLSLNCLSFKDKPINIQRGNQSNKGCSNFRSISVDHIIKDLSTFLDKSLSSLSDFEDYGLTEESFLEYSSENSLDEVYIYVRPQYSKTRRRKVRGRCLDVKNNKIKRQNFQINSMILKENKHCISYEKKNIADLKSNYSFEQLIERKKLNQEDTFDAILQRRRKRNPAEQDHNNCKNHIDEFERYSKEQKRKLIQKMSNTKKCPENNVFLGLI